MTQVGWSLLLLAGFFLGACGSSDDGADAGADAGSADAGETDAGMAMGPACEPNGNFCTEEQFCQRSVGFCRGPGTCRPHAESCDGEPEEPVCGCDGEDYVNACEAGRAGTSVDRMGPC